MKVIFIIFTLIILPASLLAEESVNVPWEEIKKLYQESIERKYQEKIDKEKEPFKYSIEQADYTITFDQKNANGNLSILGRVVSGEPSYFPMFEGDIIVSKVNRVSGGNLMCDANQRILFRPDQNKSFRILLSFLLPVQEDSQSQYVCLKTPWALKNALRLDFPSGIRLIETPGIKNAAGIYHFSPRSSVKIRFAGKKELTASKVVEIDTLSHVRIQGRQAIVTTRFYPVSPVTEPFILKLPKNALYLSASLKKSWMEKSGKTDFQIRLPPSFNDIFSLAFVYNETEIPGAFTMILPHIQDNNGHQGVFALEQPEDGQIQFTRTKMGSRIPATAVNQKLNKTVQGKPYFTKMPPGEKINLKIRRYQAVNIPPVVLDSVSLFSSFEENGSILTILRMDVPPEAGSRLSLKSVPDAEIWHLKVNQLKTKIYEDLDGTSDRLDDNRWIIPLENGNASQVELAYIRKGGKLGLHGRLETYLPETGLPSKNLHVGIALPHRVQLLSLEGPVTPAMKHSLPVPTEFVGKPYYFSRSFHNGEAMKLVVSYKEPANSKY